MKKLPFLLFTCLLLTYACSNTTPNNSASATINAERLIDRLTEIQHPASLADSLKTVTNFNQEVDILTALILADSSHTYQQLINNRLQTFDLKFLNDEEKLAIIRLYELSFDKNKSPSEGIIQVALAKLDASYPTDNELVNKEIARVVEIILKK